MEQAHVENSFDFQVGASFERTFPLFGGWGERAWAGEEWSPRFLWPDPPEDVDGEVFAVGEGDDQSVWVNTRFDRAEGRIQYVYVMPGVQAVRIDLVLVETEPESTWVRVSYQRTALEPKACERVLELGRRDREQGPAWSKAIEAFLAD